MKRIYNHIIYPIVCVVGVLLTTQIFSSCEEVIPNDSSIAEQGRVCLLIDEPEMVLYTEGNEGSVPTRATLTELMPTFAQPSVADYSYTLKLGDEVVSMGNDLTTLTTDGLILSPGTYQIRIEAGDNAFNQPYFVASKTFTLVRAQSLTLSLTPELANAVVQFDVPTDAQLESYFAEGSYAFNLTDETQTYEVPSSQIAFIPVGKPLTAHLVGTNVAGVAKQITLATLDPVRAQTLYKIRCNLQSPSVTFSPLAFNRRIYMTPNLVNCGEEERNQCVIEVSADNGNSWSQSSSLPTAGSEMVVKDLLPNTNYIVRARIGTKEIGREAVTTTTLINGCQLSHYHDGSGYLLGSNASYTIANDAFVAQAQSRIQSWELSLSTSLGVVRMASGNSALVAGTLGTTSISYPYIPKGNYDVLCTFVMTDGSTEQYTILATSPAPTFNVEAQGKSTYDYYLQGNVTDANAREAEKIYGIQCVTKISNDILNNSAYNSIKGTPLCGVDDVTVTNGGDYTVGSWGVHTVSVSHTFDGETATAQKTCHITGLPYRAPSNKKFNQDGFSWTKISGAGTTIGADYIDLTPTNPPAAKSPMFHIPNTINFTVNSKYTKNVSSTFSSYTYNVKLAEANAIITHTSKSKGTYNHTGTSAFTTSQNYISCHYSYAARGNDVTVNSIEVLYR